MNIVSKKINLIVLILAMCGPLFSGSVNAAREIPQSRMARFGQTIKNGCGQAP